MTEFGRATWSWLVAAAFLAGASHPACAAGFTSAYTKHDFEKCAALRSPHPDVVEVRSCDGLDGIKVVWTSEPDASSVAFGKPASGAERIPGLDTFFEVRGTIEWRGPSGPGGLKPIVAIVRYDTGHSVGRLGSSRLVIYRLMPDKASCLMGVVKGALPDANARARDIIDRNAPGFVCGQSSVVR